MHRRGRGYTNTAVYLGQQRYPNWNEIVEQLYRVARLLVPWYQRHSSLPPTGYETRHRLGIRDASFLYDDRCTRFTECSAYDGKERENLEGVARSPRTTGIYRFTYRARSRDAYYAFPGSWPLGRACFVLGWKCSRAKNDSRTRPFVPRSTRLGSTATPRVVLFQTTSTAQHRKTYEHECRVIAGTSFPSKQTRTEPGPRWSPKRPLVAPPGASRSASLPAFSFLFGQRPCTRPRETRKPLPSRNHQDPRGSTLEKI